MVDAWLGGDYRELKLEPEGKRFLAERLLDVLQRCISEAQPDALFHMAWLALHLPQKDEAKDYVKRGPIADTNNQHCFSIAERLDLFE